MSPAIIYRSDFRFLGNWELILHGKYVLYLYLNAMQVNKERVWYIVLAGKGKKYYEK